MLFHSIFSLILSLGAGLILPPILINLDNELIYPSYAVFIQFITITSLIYSSITSLVPFEYVKLKNNRSELTSLHYSNCTLHAVIFLFLAICAFVFNGYLFSDYILQRDGFNSVVFTIALVLMVLMVGVESIFTPLSFVKENQSVRYYSDSCKSLIKIIFAIYLFHFSSNIGILTVILLLLSSMGGATFILTLSVSNELTIRPFGYIGRLTNIKTTLDMYFKSFVNSLSSVSQYFLTGIFVLLASSLYNLQAVKMAGISQSIISILLAGISTITSTYTTKIYSAISIDNVKSISNVFEKYSFKNLVIIAPFFSFLFVYIIDLIEVWGIGYLESEFYIFIRLLISISMLLAITWPLSYVGHTLGTYKIFSKYSFIFVSLYLPTTLFLNYLYDFNYLNFFILLSLGYGIVTLFILPLSIRARSKAPIYNIIGRHVFYSIVIFMVQVMFSSQILLDSSIHTLLYGLLITSLIYGFLLCWLVVIYGNKNIIIVCQNFLND